MRETGGAGNMPVAHLPRHAHYYWRMIRTHGLTHIALTVADAERAYRFYNEVFGAEEYWRGPGQIQAKTPGAHDVLAFNEGKTGVGESGGIEHIGFRLIDPADIDAAVEAVERAGGRLLSRGDFGDGQPYAFVSDPDGYQVEIWYEK